jgi:hypothetical protein
MRNQRHRRERLEEMEKAVFARAKQNVPNQVTPDREGRRVLAPAWDAIVSRENRASSGAYPEKSGE